MSTPFSHYPKPYRECWAAHEILRNLGFAAQQIFVTRNPSPHNDLVVLLRHQGKQLAITCGVVDDDWERQWTEVAEASNRYHVDSKELEGEYMQSFAFKNKAQLLVVMLCKGIHPPYDQS